MDQDALLARRWIVDEPRFLELQPGLRIEVIQFVGWHVRNYIVAWGSCTTLHYLIYGVGLGTIGVLVGGV